MTLGRRAVSRDSCRSPARPAHGDARVGSVENAGHDAERHSVPRTWSPPRVCWILRHIRRREPDCSSRHGQPPALRPLRETRSFSGHETALRGSPAFERCIEITNSCNGLRDGEAGDVSAHAARNEGQQSDVTSPSLAPSGKQGAALNPLYALYRPRASLRGPLRSPAHRPSRPQGEQDIRTPERAQRAAHQRLRIVTQR
jgi:hypothetical protein